MSKDDRYEPHVNDSVYSGAVLSEWETHNPDSKGVVLRVHYESRPTSTLEV